MSKPVQDSDAQMGNSRDVPPLPPFDSVETSNIESKPSLPIDDLESHAQGQIAQIATISPKEAPFTELEETLRSVPWDDTFKLGHGVNALTGLGTNFSALRPSNVHEPKYEGNPQVKHQIVTNVSHMAKEVQDCAKVYLTGSMNFAPPVPVSLGVSLYTEMARFMANLSDSTAVFRDYHLWGTLPDLDLSDKSELDSKVDGLSINEFRRLYGDYWIAGVRKNYDLRVMVAYRKSDNKSESISSAKMGAKAGVKAPATSIGVGVEGSHSTRDVKDDSLEFVDLHIVPRGCSIDKDALRQILVSTSSLEAVRSSILDRKNLKVYGEPYEALLLHYSHFDAAKYPRYIDVDPSLFNRANKLLKQYQRFQAHTTHPVFESSLLDVQERDPDTDVLRRTQIINAALSKFRQDRQHLVYFQKDISQSSPDGDLDRIMQRANSVLDKALARYDLVSEVLGNRLKPANLEPVVGGYKRWEFGKVEKEVFDYIDGLEPRKSHTIELAGKEALALRGTHWRFPEEKSKSWMRVPSFLKPRSEKVVNVHLAGKLGARSGHHLKLEKGRSPAFNTAVQSKNPALILDEGAIYVLGWTLSCKDWDEKDEKPEIMMHGKNNCILSDNLDFTVPPKGNWHCRVLFVLQKDYHFPNLVPGN